MSKYKLTDADREKLLRARDLYEELESLREGLQELRLLSVSLKSPNMDGMPKGQSSGDTMTATLARIEAQERKIARTQRRLRGAGKSAGRVVKRLSGALRTFCEAYYVDGQPFAVAQAESGRQRRQCERYMAMVKTGCDIQKEDGQACSSFMI